MWNNNKSLMLSNIAVLMFMVLLIGVWFISPQLVARLQSLSLSANAVHIGIFLLTIYLGSIPAVIILVQMHLLLKRIMNGDVFVQDNVTALRIMAWCFFIGGIIAMASGFYYFPWFAIGISAGFMGLVMRVLKNVFAAAVALQVEADYTI